VPFHTSLGVFFVTVFSESSAEYLCPHVDFISMGIAKKQRRWKIVRRSGLAIIALFSFYVSVVEPNLVVVTKVTVSDSKLAFAFHDKNIVHISDLHLKKIGFREKLLLSRVNALSPDFVFITGDLLDENAEDIGPFVQYLERIQSSHGVFLVPGNTDYHYTDFPDTVSKLDKLRGTPMRLLRNENLRIELGGRIVYIVGVDDPVLGYDDLIRAMEGVPRAGPVILLAHSADILEPRGTAISVRMSKFKGERLHGWRWCDGDYSLPQQGVIYFRNNGFHTIRVQRGAHEVYVGKIILRNYGVTTNFSPSEKPEQSGDIVLDMARLKTNQIFGSWEKIKDDSLPWKYKMFDSEAKHVVEPYALVNPENYFEKTFQAAAGVPYKVWVLLSSANLTGHDHVWVQFSDSIDSFGNPIYQIANYDPSFRLRDINMTLAGHTHCGQFRVPFEFFFVRLNRYGNKYICGLYDTIGGHVYINRGIGTSYLPLRFLSPPEITVISFQKKR
jgi:predicted MPP superfamily phosphohydrolase